MTMERRIFHGNITPIDIANALVAAFNQGNLRTQMLGSDENITVQIASAHGAQSGGKTALAVNAQRHQDGVFVQVGQPEWLGVAASLGTTAISTLINPLNILGRLDDLAQDISNLQLADRVWQIVAQVAKVAGASHELSERLSRLTCEYCATANPVGEPNCIACGAPMGAVQPRTCLKCGFVLKGDDQTCPNCGQKSV